MNRPMMLLHALCSLPTAPFAEQRVFEFAADFADARGLPLSHDSFGNLLIEAPGTSKSRKLPRWVFTAHTDHPGFVARRMLDARTLEADFRGGVSAAYVRGAKVRFFDSNQEITGVVTGGTLEDPAAPGEALRIDRAKPSMAQLQRGRFFTTTLRVSAPVTAGCPGMFDQGVGREKGRKFYSRACDDLAGAAAALAMLDELSRKPADSTIAVLLTRAEEEGFIGAIAASQEPQLLRQSDLLVAIETSAEQPYAKQGDGCIVRVGDRSSVFHSGLSYFLTQQAQVLKEADHTFAYQRALMPGGTCEATVYDVYGFTAGSICVPLGNYHNMNRKKRKIGPEYIDLEDWRNMVKLFVQVARAGHEYEPGHAVLKGRIEKWFKRLRRLL